MFAEDIAEDFSEDRRYHVSWILEEYFWISSKSSEKFSEVFALWVFTLKPFPGGVLGWGALHGHT